MGAVREPSSSSCNGSQESAGEDEAKAADLVAGRPIKRFGLSNSFSCHDMRSLNEGVEEEERNQDGVQESSPRGVLEDCSSSLESETHSNKESTSTSSESEAQANHINAAHWRDFFRGFKKGAARRIQTFPAPKRGPRLTRSKTKRIREELIPVISTTTSPLDTELVCFKSSWKNFSLSDLHSATNKFSKENLIGEGGYAEVYKGQLGDGQLVAIKRLTRGSPEEMTVDFLSEIGIMVHVDHPHIAKMIGYGVEGGMHLVLQLSPNGSLASILYGPKERLDWGLRFKIALGTAKGLQYLHEGCQRRIIHKDIKAANILLTEDFEPQVSDFGLAKWLPEQWTHHTVEKIEGTFGYLPPEFFMHGIVDEKTDVFAYGVLLLELITGRQAIDSSQQSIVMWAKPMIMKNKIKELVDPALAGAYDVDQMERMVFTASFCIHQSAVLRPHMNQVLEILQGNKKILEELKELQQTIHQRTYSEELFDADEYNSTKYHLSLSDINRQMEFVLGDDDELSEDLQGQT
ncbi:receptor-like cytosolic serine/threonine-protein kinase RBK2 isoform X4 [Jatropha curcas]|uniref:receptor-like cytosolic serine/threonine-protein kinase RBK2 isoform X4 n=1 Tax=Jatropha curcas TaxID=180498 RepID=UPI001892F757|nr:receptor-like cytosolic serine/threonine-protein kinase RBK2 isoform X4 [Jatropha curcas]